MRISALPGLSLVLSAILSASAATRIYWSATDATGSYVVRAEGDGSNPTNIVSGAANILGPNGLESAHGLLFWPDQQLGAIRQVNPDGTGIATVTLAQNPYDVFVKAQQVYWTSQQRNYIDTVQTNGAGYLRILASPTVSQPFAIEVTASNLYWSQVNGSGSIRRSDLDGSNIVTVIPNAYVYDFQVTSNFIYFADNNFPSAIKRANLDGSGITNLVADGGFYNGVCVTTEAIYWSALNDADGGGIRRADLDGRNATNLYNAPFGTSIRGVVVLADTVTGPHFGQLAASVGQFKFTLEVDPGTSYRIETSANLTNWTEITNFVGSTRTITITNAVPAGSDNLFFRARTF